MDKMDEIIDLSLPVGNEKKTFRTPEDLYKFLSLHVDFISEFDLTALVRSSIHDRIRNMLNNASQIAESFRKKVISGESIDSVVHFVQETFANEFPPYTSREASALKSIHDDYGSLAFVGAYLTHARYNLSLNLQDEQILWGSRAFTAIMQGLHPNTAVTVERELASTKQYFQKQAENASNIVGQTTEDASRLIDQMTTAISNSAFASDYRMRRFLLESHKKVEDAISRFDTFQSAYADSMRLNRPRKYWSKKAENHEKAVKIYRSIAISWLVLAGGITVFGLWQLFEYARSAFAIVEGEIAIPTSLLVTLGAMGLVGSTVYFWIARLLVRLWLSDLHLSMDARERVTMIESFLSLRASGAVSDEERQLVLAAIFRPTQDGIVKDDASTDPLTVAIASKVLK